MCSEWQRRCNQRLYGKIDCERQELVSTPQLSACSFALCLGSALPTSASIATTIPATPISRLLRQTFSYTGYWLNNPPGGTSNSWAGHRAAVESAGFGFLVLFNGRLYAELKTVANAQRLGKADAVLAASSARREGFPRGTIIFLDQEQGGRMLPEQKAYIYAWVDAITAAGFRAGIYCSGIRCHRWRATCRDRGRHPPEPPASRRSRTGPPTTLARPRPGARFRLVPAEPV